MSFESDSEQLRPGEPGCPLVALKPRSIAYPSDHTTAICSPSRVWSDLFWLSMDAEALRSALGGLRIFEIGYGDGRYVEFYKRAFGALESYSGIDPQPRDSWKEARPGCRFIQATAEQLGPEVLGASNLILSQSAIEHITDDVGLFRTIGHWAASEARPFNATCCRAPICSDSMASTDFPDTRVGRCGS